MYLFGAVLNRVLPSLEHVPIPHQAGLTQLAPMVAGASLEVTAATYQSVVQRRLGTLVWTRNTALSSLLRDGAAIGSFGRVPRRRSDTTASF
jgi:hypothetical protein